MACLGNGDDHCCYLNGNVCPHLQENTAGRRWACGLLLKYGSWAAMESSPEYLKDVQPFWDGFRDGSGSCSKWPDDMNEVCATCGAGTTNGDG